MKQILFYALALDNFGRQYDASFSVSWPASEKPDELEINVMTNLAVKQFKEYHPSGQIFQTMRMG